MVVVVGLSDSSQIAYLVCYCSLALVSTEEINLLYKMEHLHSAMGISVALV